MGFHLGEVADVADVIAFAVFIEILVVHLLSADGGDAIEGFKDGDAVGSAAADVVNLATTGGLGELMHEADDIEGVDVVPDLFALVSEDLVLSSRDVALDEVAEESVEFDSAVVGAGEASAAQAAGFHAEVASIFLNHDIGGNFGGTEEAVLALIDRELLSDAVYVSVVIVIPARGEFLEPDGIGPVAVNLIGAHVDEHGFRRMLPGSFQHVQGADRIRVEVIEGTGSGEIVTGLGRGMDNHVRLQGFEASENRFAVSDVEFMMMETRELRLETLLVPTGVALRAEEIGAHVVVHSVDLPAKLAEILNDFRADEAGGSGDEE